MTIDTDNFNRADADTLGTTAGGRAWSATYALDGTPRAFGISSNQAYIPSGTIPYTIARMDSGLTDGHTQALVHTTTTGAGVLFRYSTPGNYYVLWKQFNAVLLYRVQGSFSTSLGSATITDADHVLRADYDGLHFAASVDGVEVFSGTETVARVVGSGCGLFIFAGTTPRWDDFETSVLVSTPGGLQVPPSGLPI